MDASEVRAMTRVWAGSVSEERSDWLTDLRVEAHYRAIGQPHVENPPAYVQTQHPVGEGDLVQALLRLEPRNIR